VNADDPRDPGIDATYQATARDEPPRALDERILAAAHRAVDARPVPAGRSFAQRWRVPVGLAATIVLSATVTLMVYESEKAPPVPDELRPGKVLRDDRNLPATEAPRRAVDKESGAQESKPEELQERGRKAPQRAAPSRSAPADEDAVRQLESRKRDPARSNEAKSAPGPFPAEPVRPAAPPALAVPPPAAAPLAKDVQAPAAKKRDAPADAREKMDELRSSTTRPRPELRGQSGLGGSSSAAPAPETPAATIREGTLADRPAGRLERDAATAAEQSAMRSPEDWIAEIRRLKQAGRTEDANRLLAEFRVRFPDRSLPEDLR